MQRKQFVPRDIDDVIPESHYLQGQGAYDDEMDHDEWYQVVAEYEANGGWDGCIPEVEAA